MAVVKGRCSATFVAALLAMASTAGAQPAAPAAEDAAAQRPAQAASALTVDFAHVSTVRDPEHAPRVEVPETVGAGEWFAVTVEVGRQQLHPSRVDDHVRAIVLLKDDVEIARATLHPVHSLPRVTFWIALAETATLRVLAEPSHAAAYEASSVVVVEP